MQISPFQNIIGAIRKKTPLALRHIIGPVLAYVLYIWNVSIWRDLERLEVVGIPETVGKVNRENLSVIRFGDGAVFLIDGGNTAFQPYQKQLAEKLESIIQAKDPRLLICIPGVFGRLDMFEPYAYWFNMHHVYRHAHEWKALTNPSQIYGDTNMTRPYLAYKDKKHAGAIFAQLFSIWEGKDVVLIEGAKSRLGVGNDMFAKTKSVKRILCPAENAFAAYDRIKREAEKSDTKALILISLGPAAKVLAYDLFKLGFRVLDIGHIDMEYEMYLQKATKQVKVRYKYFNEIHERNPEECTDPKYLSEIIATIA